MCVRLGVLERAEVLGDTVTVTVFRLQVETHGLSLE